MAHMQPQPAVPLSMAGQAGPLMERNPACRNRREEGPSNSSSNRNRLFDILAASYSLFRAAVLNGTMSEPNARILGSIRFRRVFHSNSSPLGPLCSVPR
jgi:hypothetical protein